MNILLIISLILAGILVFIGSARAAAVMEYNRDPDLPGKMKFGHWELSALIGAAWIIFYFAVEAIL